MMDFQWIAVSSVHENERILGLVLLQVAVILVFARFGGMVARRMGQPRVVGEIVAGLMLGPSLLQPLAPDLFAALFPAEGELPLFVLSQIGLVLLMFSIGLEFDFGQLRDPVGRRAMIRVAILGIVAPFTGGFLLGRFSHPYLAPDVDPLGYSLFMATAMAITAIPILGRIMMEFGLTRTRLGAVTITAAAINDVIGWLLLAAISALVAASFAPGRFSLQMVLLVLYFVLAWILLRPLLRRLIDWFSPEQGGLHPTLLAIILAVVFLSSVVTYQLGIFAIFGGFLIGVLLYDRKEFVEAWRERVDGLVSVFFLPLFFTYTGLRTDVRGLDSLELWGWCAAVIVVATVGKFAFSYWAARSAGMDRHESGCIGIMMNTRALMELIVLNVGYDLGVLPSEVFTMLVIMAVFTTILTSPLLRFWLPRMGHRIPAA